MQLFLWRVAEGRKTIKLELSLDDFSLSTFPAFAFEAQLPPSPLFILTCALIPCLSVLQEPDVTCKLGESSRCFSL